MLQGTRVLTLGPGAGRCTGAAGAEYSAGGLCARCYDVGIADFPATATLLASIRPCIITSKVKQQVMGSMDQRVPWNQFNSEAKVGRFFSLF